MKAMWMVGYVAWSGRQVAVDSMWSTEEAANNRKQLLESDSRFVHLIFDVREFALDEPDGLLENA